MNSKKLLTGPAIFLACHFVLPTPAHAYVDGPPASLGMMCHWSTHIIQVRVERVDKDKGIIVWRKLKDYKGKWPGGDTLTQNFAGYPERAYVMQWADVGKATVLFALESYRWSHVYIDKLWCSSVTPDWRFWTAQRVQPVILRTYCGRTEKLQAAVSAILTGNEVVVPCMVDSGMPDLLARRAKVQRLKASLKLLDYNAKRDFVGWGDDFEPLVGLKGFSHASLLGQVGPEAQAISFADIENAGKPDLCLIGTRRVSLWQNSGGLIELHVPGLSAGCRAGVWADYNGDGLPDLLLATVAGPRLYTNLGKGQFRDDSHVLPKEECSALTAAWLDYDGDGRPDILLGLGVHGLRLFRNKGKGAPLPAPPKPGVPALATDANRWFEDISATVGLGPGGIGSDLKGDTLTVCDVDGDGRADFLYGAGRGLLVLNTTKGFLAVKESGIDYQAGKAGAVFGDFEGSGAPGLFVPQRDGRCKLFKNDGKGRFTDVTAASGDLARPMGLATSAAWGDLDNDGHLDLVVGCLKGPNRFFRNRGDGTFVDATEEIGLHRRIFNTQAVGIADLNQDGFLDVVFNNEGQDSVVLLADATLSTPRTPVTLALKSFSGTSGARIRFLDETGKEVAARQVGLSEGRGGQAAPQAHFALPPGNYRLEIRFSTGLTRAHELAVERIPVRRTLSEK